MGNPVGLGWLRKRRLGLHSPTGRVDGAALVLPQQHRRADQEDHTEDSATDRAAEGLLWAARVGDLGVGGGGGRVMIVPAAAARHAAVRLGALHGLRAVVARRWVSCKRANCLFFCLRCVHSYKQRTRRVRLHPDKSMKTGRMHHSARALRRQQLPIACLHQRRFCC